MEVHSRAAWYGSSAMKRHGRLATWIAGLAGALTVALAVTAGERVHAPVDKVVLITIDTLRADHVGAYGGPVPTPAIDRLAAECVLLEQAFTPTASTGPAAHDPLVEHQRR